MNKCFTNADVFWNARDIIHRENLIREIPAILEEVWTKLNPAVRLERIETPILTPPDLLRSHEEANFELISTGKRGYLRPETTAGTFYVMNQRFDNNEVSKKNFPHCLWQVGLSFRDEKNSETMRASKLRLVQFYQMEFQLFCMHGTKAPYLEKAIEELCKVYDGDVVEPSDLPHYSERTLDWEMGGLEVAGLSIRKDWKHGVVFEVAIGLDRLVAMRRAKEGETDE